ncbi:helix-turn-helix transcriptional regulator [Shewanella baltica]|uniref:helix-turn-helix domain-containing protein n=1 Tax=Shewanella baltica TaxID=62322 RepID=UPI00217E487B|nr:helix-turn-helix transcriptional regulator [Shewanella baltica]MCS6259828.1 helix-turn-helix transcriptional regulator [Shewanella baltica]
MSIHTVNIGLSLKILMKKHGTCRAEISKYIGITPGTLSRVSNSQLMGVRHLDELSRYFNLAPSDFLKESENALDEIVNAINSKLDKAKVSERGVQIINSQINLVGLEAVVKSVDELTTPCNITWAEDIQKPHKGGTSCAA